MSVTNGSLLTSDAAGDGLSLHQKPSLIPQTINSGILKGSTSILSYTLYCSTMTFSIELCALSTFMPMTLSFIFQHNLPVSVLILYHANDSTLRFSTSFTKRPNQPQLSDSQRDATEPLIPDIFIISE